MLPVRLNQKTIKKYVMIREKREKVLGEQKKKKMKLLNIFLSVYIKIVLENPSLF